MKRHYPHIFRPDARRPSARPLKLPDAPSAGTLVLQTLVAALIGLALGALFAWAFIHSNPAALP